MIKSILAYDISDLEKMHIISKSKNLFKNGIIDGDQWNSIREDYKSRIYSPPVHIKLPLFFISSLGLLFGFGLISFSFSFFGFQIQALIGGVVLLFLTEKTLIRSNFHFSSGVTEAGVYSGFTLLAVGLFGDADVDPILYLLIGFIFTLFIAIRYLDILALIAAVISIVGIVFRFTDMLGGLIQVLLPFILMGIFAGLFFFSNNYEKKLPQVIFKNHFIIVKSLSLIIVYLAVNYFVVRELSIELMGLNLTGSQDIPFGFLFYIFTVALPIGYIYWGLQKKSLLFIRIGILTTLLTGITFYNYFLSDYTMYVVILTGAILILISLLFFKSLKINEIGFTSEKILDDTWNTKEIGMGMVSKMVDFNHLDPPKKDDW